MSGFLKSFSLMSTILARKMKYLEGTICAKFYSHSVISLIFTAYNGNVWITVHTEFYWNMLSSARAIECHLKVGGATPRIPFLNLYICFLPFYWWHLMLLAHILSELSHFEYFSTQTLYGQWAWLLYDFINFHSIRRGVKGTSYGQVLLILL